MMNAEENATCISAATVVLLGGFARQLYLDPKDGNSTWSLEGNPTWTLWMAILLGAYTIHCNSTWTLRGNAWAGKAVNAELQLHVG